MKKIDLNNKKFMLVDDDDYNFFSKHLWYAYKSGNIYYARRNIWIRKGEQKSCKTLLVHRIIMKISNPKIHVDHINGNGLDNRRVNLRLATSQQNQRNLHNSYGKSKYKGVYFHKVNRKWMAQISVNKKHQGLGGFSSEEEAARKYNSAAIILFGEYAHLNIVES